MRRLLDTLTDAMLRLTGTGAAANAHLEVDRAVTSVTNVEAQLSRVSDPIPRRAA